MRRIWLVPLVISLVMATPALARRGGFGGPKMDGRGPGLHLGLIGRCLLDAPELKLTREQRMEIHAVMDELRQDMLEQSSEIKAIHDEFIKAFADPGVSNDELKKKALAIHDRIRARIEAKWETAMKIRSILTPEQLKMVPSLKRCQGFFGPPGPPLPAD